MNDAAAAPSTPLRERTVGPRPREIRSPAALGVTGFLRRALSYLRPYWVKELLILLALMVGIAFNTILPLSYKFLIDQAIIPGERALVALILGGLAALFVVQVVATLGSEYLTARVGADALADMRVRIFGHLQHLSLGFYSRAQAGDIVSRMSGDLLVIEQALVRVLPAAITLVLSLVVSTAVLFYLEWRLALLATVMLPAFFVGPRLFGGRAARASYERQKDAGQIASTVQENVLAQPVVKAFGLQQPALARFREQAARLARSTVRVTFLGSLLGATVSLSASAVNLMALGIGALMVVNGNLSLGVLVAFLGLLANVIAPLGNLSKITQALQQATGGMQRVDELLDQRPEVTDAPAAQPLPRLKHAIRFKDVTFSYTGEQVNLRGLNLTILAGQTVAVVGPSGCGKSTILSLIMRAYDPGDGAVLLDGVDLRSATQDSLSSQVGVVLQDSFLFDTTVRENIRVGRLDATDAEVEAAARAAEIHDVIVGMPQGYDTMVGERGSRLSGGQRQRIAIARAVLRDPAILLLDEATSALDPQTEAAINDTLARLAQGRTVVMVTHRLASAINAGCIVVLDRGELVEHGTHAELLRREGLYHRLWQQQQCAAAAGEVDPERLRAVPFFEHLDGVLLSTIAGRLVLDRYPEGETVFAEGDAGDRLYVIVRGQVEVIATGATGEERRLALLRDGDYFGETALLRDVPRNATVRTRAPSLFLTLGREQFLALMRSDANLCAAFEQESDARGDQRLHALNGAVR